jgi:hypothetical protein
MSKTSPSRKKAVPAAAKVISFQFPDDHSFPISSQFFCGSKEEMA